MTTTDDNLYVLFFSAALLSICTVVSAHIFFLWVKRYLLGLESLSAASAHMGASAVSFVLSLVALVMLIL